MRVPSLRRPWVAAVLSLLCVGLGFAYAGRVVVGAVLHVAWLALTLVAMWALLAGPSAALLAMGGLLAMWLAQTWLAARATRTAAPFTSGAGLRWLALVAFYGGTVALAQLALPPFKSRTGSTFYVPSGGMVPTIQIGDYMVVRARTPTERGTVIVHEAPAGSRRPDALVKRVVGVGGDTVELQGGRLILNGVAARHDPVAGRCTYWDRKADDAWRELPCRLWTEELDGHAYLIQCEAEGPCGDDHVPVTVPPGHVWVLGDHRDRSADSRVYGPVAEEAVLGRVEWIVASWGPSGLRPDRTGARVR